jgi:hypothetical protein
MEAITPNPRASFLAPISVRRYLFFTTILGVFSGALNIYVGSTIYLFYIVMLSNILLIWAFLPPLIFPKWLGWFLFYLLASGGIGLYRGTDTIFQVAKLVGAISMSALYFANFFHLERNSVDNAWAGYAKIAYWLTLVALVIWPVQCVIKHEVVRLHGVASEPSEYCVITLPAYYWYAHQWLSRRKHRKEVLLITLGVALSGSSTGYIAVAFGLLLLFGKRVTGLMIATLLACGLGMGLYAISSDVRLRVNDTLGALASNDVSGTNLSTFALLSNMFVTERVLEVHPILGNGLGSHSLSSKRFIQDLPGVDVIEGTGWDSAANVEDASSLTLRVLSELGLMGFVGVLWFIVHFRVTGSGDRAAICGAILTVFLQKLLRGGGYSNLEQFFFIMVYMLNYRQFKQEAGKATALHPARDILPQSQPPRIGDAC